MARGAPGHRIYLFDLLQLSVLKFLSCRSVNGPGPVRRQKCGGEFLQQSSCFRYVTCGVVFFLGLGLGLGFLLAFCLINEICPWGVRPGHPSRVR